jgi:O-antigen chain-terminating methyltransferase
MVPASDAGSINRPDTSGGIKNELQVLDFESKCNNLNWNLRIETPITSHRKFLGPVLVFGRRLVRKYLRWYINPPLEQQKEFNASATRSINSITRILYNYNGKLRDTNSKLEEMSRKNAEYEREIQGLEEKARDNKENINRYIAELEVIKKDYARISRQHADMQDLILKTRECTDGPAEGKTTDDMSSIIRSNLNYFEFEGKFRGDRASVKDAQKIYVDYFKGRQKVLDIGCGRGEFLELLAENDIGATGIDIDAAMVEFCRQKGLPVINGDIFEHLDSVDDGSLDGIFSSQVIEHLNTASLLKLISLARLKLKPSGVIVLETINPACLIALANSFYMDLTHVRPVHPLTLQYILEADGYRNVNLLYSCPAKDYLVPHLRLDAEKDNINEFNESIDKLNQTLYGNQHYAVIGYR